MIARLRANLRSWWPELLVGALLVVIAFAGQKDDPLFAAFCAVIGAGFWALGFRHRRLSLHKMIGDVRQDVADVKDIVLTIAEDPEGKPGRPPRPLRLVRRD